MKRLLFLSVVLMLSLITLIACGTSSSETSDTSDYTVPQDTSSTQIETEKNPIPVVHVISPEEAKAMMDQGGVIIVDVRRADEYAAGHIEGALLVPNETIQDEAATALPDKDAVYLIYCRSGNRSNVAAHKLIALGYQNVYDFGGILTWDYGTVK